VSPLARKVLDVALTQVGVREHGRNRSPEIDGYNRDIGHDPTKQDPWCAIFVCAMVRRACAALGLPEPIPMTAGVYTLEEKTDPRLRTTTPVEGSIFLLGHVDKGKRILTHTGFVRMLAGGFMSTVEGNTNGSGSPDGDGVYERTRPVGAALAFIDLNLA